jgi:heme-degrading monooxygenase HmoA
MAEHSLYSASVWQVKPGLEDTFIAEWTAATKESMGVDGAVEAILLQDKQNPHRMISISPWESMESLGQMRQTPGFRPWIARARELCVDYHASAFDVAVRLGPDAG